MTFLPATSRCKCEQITYVMIWKFLWNIRLCWITIVHSKLKPRTRSATFLLSGIVTKLQSAARVSTPNSLSRHPSNLLGNVQASVLPPSPGSDQLVKRQISREKIAMGEIVRFIWCRRKEQWGVAGIIAGQIWWVNQRDWWTRPPAQISSVLTGKLILNTEV